MEWRFIDPKHYKLARLISYERKMNITELCKDTGFVPSHLSIVFNWWQECGLIKKIKEGQDTYIEFTDFGKEVYKVLDKFAQLSNQAMKNREKLMEVTQ